MKGKKLLTIDASGSTSSQSLPNSPVGMLLSPISASKAKKRRPGTAAIIEDDVFDSTNTLAYKLFSNATDVLVSKLKDDKPGLESGDNLIRKDLDPIRLQKSVKLTMQNVWIKPKEISKSELLRNSKCEICLKSITFCPTIDACCQFCNIVCHITCIPRSHRKYANNGSWVCFLCIDDLESSKRAFRKRQLKIGRYKLENNSQIILSKYYRRYKERKKYKLIYKSVIKIQMLIKVMFRKKVLLKRRQEKLRPIVISAIKAHNLWEGDKLLDIFVAITICDEVKVPTFQTFRIDTPVLVDRSHSPVINKTAMFAGVSGIQTVIFTVFSKGNTRDQCFGQCFLKLAPGSIWRRGGTFTLPLGEVNIIPKTLVGQEMKGEFINFIPRGELTFSINPCPQKSSECGAIDGTVLEDLVKVVKNNPASNVMWIPQTTAPLQLGKNSDGKIGLKKLWIAIADGNLYLYSRFGDALKLVVNLKLIEISFLYEFDIRKGNLVSIGLKKSGYPDINFLTRKSTDNFSWIVAFACYQERYLKNHQLDIKLVLKDLKKHDTRVKTQKRLKTPAILTKTGLAVNTIEEFSMLNHIYEVDSYIDKRDKKNLNIKDDIGSLIEIDIDINNLSLETASQLETEFDDVYNDKLDNNAIVDNALTAFIDISKNI